MTSHFPWTLMFFRPEERLSFTFSSALSMDRLSSAAWRWLENLLVCYGSVLSNSVHCLPHGYNSLMKGSQAEQALPVVNIPHCMRGRYTSYFREISCDCSCSLQFLHLVWIVLQKPIDIFELLSKFYLDFCSMQGFSHCFRSCGQTLSTTFSFICFFFII